MHRRRLNNPVSRGSINFRERRFNSQVDYQIKYTHDLLHRNPTFQEKSFVESLEKVYQTLISYYEHDRSNDFSPHKATQRAKEVFSEYCQNLVYYIIHNIKDNVMVNCALITLINQPLFFYCDEDGQPTIWCDPKELTTVLNVASRYGNVDILRQILNKIQNDFNILPQDSIPEEGELIVAKDIHGFCAVLTHLDKDQFSPLNTASKEGHVEVVRELLAAAEIAFGGKATQGFCTFLNQVNKDQFSPLNSAACAGHVEVVRELLAAAEIAFGGKTTPEFCAFLTHLDKDQFSPLNTASNKGHVEVVRELLAAAEVAFGGKATPEFCAFLMQVNKDQFSPLNTASKEGHVEVVRELLAAAEIAFGGKMTREFCAFLTHLDKDQFSPLNTASKEGHVEVVRELLAAAEVAFGGKATPEFVNFLEQKNAHGFTPLNACCKAGRNESVVHLLMEYGANPTIRNKKYLCALENMPRTWTLYQNSSQRDVCSPGISTFSPAFFQAGLPSANMKMSETLIDSKKIIANHPAADTSMFGLASKRPAESLEIIDEHRHSKFMARSDHEK